MEAIPRWLSAYLDSEGKARIEAAIAKAEAATSGEIVPMIVHRSTHTGHVRWILFFALVSVLVALAPSGLLLLPPPIQTWMPLLGLEAGMIAIAWVFAAQLARMDFFQRLCTPEADQDAATMMRAELEFFESGIKKTQAQTGVLIFVSLLEHEAVVLADEAISRKLPEEVWENVVRVLIQGIRRKDFAGGMCEAIQETAKLLAPHFPVQAGDRNELANRLRIED